MIVKGNRKLTALIIAILGGLIGGIYMGDTSFVSFTTLLIAGVGLFSHFNIKEHENN